jgi:hypothetical protein
VGRAVASIQTFEHTTLLTWMLGRGWWFVYLPFAALETRLLWEQTWLTWTRGEQMIGFSLAHQHPELLLLGFLGAIGTGLWVLAAVMTLGLRRNRLLTMGKVQLCLAAGTLVLAFLPVDRWVLRLG